MQIAGFQKQSLIDYPGNISSVVFTQGCNFRCPYCHNPELVLPERFAKPYDKESILNYIFRYRHLLTAVCITGGEPTLHKKLPDFITRIKETGLKVKLDTNGTNPEMLKFLIDSDMIDFVAMDIKHLMEYKFYNKATGGNLTQLQFSNVLQSVALIKNSGIGYEFRTTVAKGLHEKKHLQTLIGLFGKNFTIHNLNPGIMLQNNGPLKAFSPEEIEDIYHETINQEQCVFN